MESYYEANMNIVVGYLMNPNEIHDLFNLFNLFIAMGTEAPVEARLQVLLADEAQLQLLLPRGAHLRRGEGGGACCTLPS